jgi:hypothetical protein
MQQHWHLILCCLHCSDWVDKVTGQCIFGSPSPSPSFSPTPSPLPPPPNDAFANASTQLPGIGTTVGATLEPGEPLAGRGARASIWYLWIAVCDSLSALMSVRAKGFQALQLICERCMFILRALQAILHDVNQLSTPAEPKL